MKSISSEIKLNISFRYLYSKRKFFDKYGVYIVAFILTVVSVMAFSAYYGNGLGLAYNDARSHLDIARRVVEGLKPGIAQLGSVWLPLPHILMIPTVWNDFMWHSGLSGALVSMVAFIVTGVLIYKYLGELKVGILGKYFGVFVFAANLNILYLQSTAMTELLLICTMMYASYELLLWHKEEDLTHLLKCAIWVMLSTLTRYDGWFLLFWSSMLIIINTLNISSLKHDVLKKQIVKRFNVTKGTFVVFFTLAGFGVILWLLWNLVIFRDPLYFALGPFSAKSQQDQLESAGVLQTKHNLLLSIKFYMYALIYNSNAFIVILSFIGAFVLYFSKDLPRRLKAATTALIAPIVFNVLALYIGHSVLFIQGLSGDSWFNVRYGIMLMPAIAIFVGYLVDRVKEMRSLFIGLSLFVLFFSFSSYDAVTIDDARVGASQKNVSEVTDWLKENAADESGFILISAASHDAIIFSSGMPMKRFIHEGTGLYWESAVALPDRWARWIILRTHDESDLTYRSIKDTVGFERYNLVGTYPFADIYELKPEYLDQLNTQESFSNQR